LERGGPGEARFLLLRARTLVGQQDDRSVICAAAAAELARGQRDMPLVDEAVELTREKLGPTRLTLTLEQAADVVRKEKAARTFPKYASQGPKYANLLPRDLCQCPNCRRRRGETVDPYDEFDEFGDDFDETDEELDAGLEDLFDEFELPPGMPPEIARMLFDEVKRAAANGESLDELMARLTGSRRGGRSRKGRRR
jgi:hypothetical protein